MVVVRPERPEDRPTIRRIHQRAFARANEATLVDTLREAGLATVSLVAEIDGTVVGHVLFSPVAICADEQAAVGLAPMAVLPGHQRAGVGSALVQAGLDECRRLGHQLVIVVGHADLYSRFGFSPAHSHGLRCEYPVPDDVFLVAELVPGALAGRRGLVRFRPQFASV
jgi:putative acetyltransferase